MKTAAIFAAPTSDLVRVQCRLMTLLTCGDWRIVIPDQARPVECQIVETCLTLKRELLVLGTTARSKCGAPARCYQKITRLSRLWQESEWQRDGCIIELADCVECFGLPDIEERVPLHKRSTWMSLIRVIEPIGLGHVDYDMARTRGLGALLVQKLAR